MSAVAELTVRTITTRSVAIGTGLLLAAEAILAICAWLVPIEPLLRGWLVAFAVWSCIPIGSTVLLLVHFLTGGEWGEAAAPVQRPAAAMTPLVALAFLPVLVGLHHVYPWGANNSAIPADVARWYLNGPSFTIRALIAIVGWSLLGVMFALGIGSRLLAGLGLAFFGLTISLVAVDWFLSVEPHYKATAFAAMIAVQQLLAALAVTSVIGTRMIRGKVAGDIGGLLISLLLGVVYLEFMTFVVAWYGDLPDKAEWFLKRQSFGWIAVLIAAIAIGAALPFAMLLIKPLRRSAHGLRIAGALVLGGTILHFTWLLVPAFDNPASVIVAAGVSLLALTLVSMLIGSGLATVMEPRRAE